MKNLPIGTQSFEVLRNDNAIYVDKTQHMLNLISSGRIYFLSRPRRFGKSLLINTFKELFKGNKQLFEGLYIYDKWDWSKKYPVIHLDFTELDYATAEQLETSLDKFLDDTAKRENITLDQTKTRLISSKFSELIKKLHESTGKQVALLIDEYDKPMIDSLIDKPVHDKLKRILHNFYQVIKGSDGHLKFVFMTGVSRFAGLSIFSALNNLIDITMDAEFSTICGYTQEELESSFKEYIELAAKNLNLTYEETISTIKRWYNGYSWNGKTSVYNPFSTLDFFRNKEFKGYWFSTGTPTFLLEQIKNKDLSSFEQPQKVTDYMLSNFNERSIDITGLLFQTGYLTIKNKETIAGSLLYTLDFPNKEVKDAFLMVLVSEYAGKSQIEIFDLNIRIHNALINKNGKELQEALTELYANAVYDTDTKQEGQRQTLFVFTARLSGFEIETEVHTNKGRIDVVLKHKDFVVVVEIKYAKGKGSKLESKLKEAMVQIRRNKYYEKYINSNPILLGIVFSEKKEIRCKFERVK
ncbi:MAG: ATP-binding protein [Endomicrobium sp.]|jgi:hypothetical protein|nr:ATP-binding protein [Endomicrobium sp.]